MLSIIIINCTDLILQVVYFVIDLIIEVTQYLIMELKCCVQNTGNILMQREFIITFGA